jgi:hypothetical protein
MKDNSHSPQKLSLETVAKTLGIVAGFQIEIATLKLQIKNNRLNA